MLQSTIERMIYTIRSEEVMLDSDIAILYGVETRQINQAVSRNIERFPSDFMFTCNTEEWESLRSQNVTLNESGRGQHRKYAPKVFTEQGVYMLATVLKSEKATEVTLSIMRTFTKIRRYAQSHKELARQIYEIKQELTESKSWTKDKLSAVADAMIVLEESIEAIEEALMSFKSANEIEKIGFTR